MSQDANGDLYDVAYTAGTWDIFHIGHLRLLERARSMSKFLIVGVSTDDLVLEYKGRRTVDDFETRYRTACQVSHADAVVPQIRQFDAQRMKRLGVSHVIMGDDWEKKSSPGLDLLKEVVEVVFVPRTAGVSTSTVREVLGK